MTTIRTREPRDLLALVPYRLGFRPRASTVLMSVRQGRGEVGLVARVDTVDLLGPDGDELAAALAAHLLGDGASRAVAVVYTSREDGAEVDAAVDVLQRAAVGGLDVECWVVGPRGWWCATCSDDRCCPPGGRPLSDLESAPVSAAMVLAGATVAADRDALGDVGTVPAERRRSARRAAERWTARRALLGGRVDDARWRAEGLALWRGCVAALEAGGGHVRQGIEVRPTTLGRLQAALDDVLVRDAVLLTLVPDHGGQTDLPDRVLVRDPSADIGIALGALTDPRLGLPPDADRSRASDHVLRAVAAHAGPDGHAPSLTLLAVLAWWSGEGARAAVLLDRALAARPAYRLAVIVQEAVALGVPPGWVSGARAG